MATPYQDETPTPYEIETGQYMYNAGSQIKKENHRNTNDKQSGTFSLLLLFEKSDIVIRKIILNIKSSNASKKNDEAIALQINSLKVNYKVHLIKIITGE